MTELRTKRPALAYATKGNILFPGTQAQADAAELVAKREAAGVLGADAGTTAVWTTAMSGSDNDITFLAREPGTGGNAITTRIVVSGASTALSVSVSTSAITINSATTSGSAASSTADEVIAAVNADAACAALVLAERAPSNAGTGVVAAYSATNLIGGSASDPSLRAVNQLLTITPAG